MPVAFVLAALVAGGCGDEVVSEPGQEPQATSSSTTTMPTSPAGDTRYTATATVLESAEHGPQLCLGGVAESYPPQCGGPDVIGWDWATVDGKESANETTWGTYTVVGTWDGGALTLTEPATEPDPDVAAPAPDLDDRFATPCDPPDGGWRVVDPDTATDEAMNRAGEYAASQPDVGGRWVDQSINPASAEDNLEAASMNDPSKLILNVSFTGDLDRHEAAVRKIWGGPLCVSQADKSAAELATIRAEVEAELGPSMLYSSSDEVNGRVEIGVVIDDGTQERFDDTYGDGVVELTPALRPVED